MSKGILLHLRKNSYLILPVIFIIIWLLIAVIKRLPLESSGIFYSDFSIYYHFSRRWFVDPSNIYSEGFFYYHPFALIFLLIIFGFLPVFFAHWLNFVLIFIFYTLLIIEADKLFKFANLNKKVLRSIFLIIIINGWHIYMNFYYNTFKPLIAFVIIFLLRREIQFNRENREKNLEYYFINYFLFLLVLCIAPYLFYFFIIYVFYDIPLKHFFKKENIRRYGIIAIIIFAQNFIFIIFPSLIVGFLNGLLFPTKSLGEPYFFYLFLPIFFTPIMRSILTIIIAIFLLIVAIIITNMPKLNLQQKFSYYALFHLVFSPFRNYYFLTMLLALVMVIYIPFIKDNNRFFNFIRQNILIIVGCSAIAVYLLYIDYFSGVFAASLIFIFVMSIVLLHYYNWDLTREIFFT